MAEVRCPKCGKKLESSSADCPACLLKLALKTSLKETESIRGRRLSAKTREKPKPGNPERLG